MLSFGSMFTGIGGFDLALERAGMECKWQAELDPKCAALLASKWPKVPNIGDVKNVRRSTVEPVNVIVGGFPCQDLSVAGKRAGLAGERSGLWFEFARVIDELEPRGFIIENVPGLLSSDEGRDFAIIVRWLAERGYGVAWRILDAQYFGLAQRRRRVFIVGSIGNGRAAEILFEREGLLGDIETLRAQRKVAPALAASGVGAGRTGNERTEAEFMIPMVAPTIGAGDGAKWGSNQWIDNEQYIAFQQNTRDEVRQINGDGQIARPLSAEAGMKQQNYVMAHGQANAEIVRDGEPSLTINHEAPIAFTADGYGSDVGDNISPTLEHGSSAKSGHGSYKKKAIAWKERGGVGKGGKGFLGKDEMAFSVGGGIPRVGVRRLTPIECERLQGFPDGWTEGQADSVRYRQLGNAVAVPVVEWIARRMVKAFSEE